MNSLTIYVPPNTPTSFEYEVVDGNKRTRHMAMPRLWHGVLVIDVPLATFRSVLRGPQGLLWEASNPEALEWISTNPDARSGVMTCNVFPGSKRFEAPQAKPEPAPTAMIKLAVPAGVSGACIAGEPLTIGADGTVVVTAAIADVLRSHGFRDAA